MSDYFDYYDTSDYDERSDEDNYAGAYGGYDDLYDDVMEEAGYDAWDIENPEFGYDDEWPMFVFDPFSEYFDLKDDSDKIMMTYQALSLLSENTSKLLEAWAKRSELVSDFSERQDSSVPSPSSDHAILDIVEWECSLNLYQLELEDRDELRAFSVMKLERLCGGRAKVNELKQMVDKISVFLKRVMMTILSSSLPCPVPYPAMNTILAYLLPGKGAGNLGQVSSNKTDIELEREAMEQLYLSMAEVFDHVKVIMFNIEPNTLVTEPSIVEKKRNLEENFSVLVTKVTDSELQISIEGLEIN